MRKIISILLALGMILALSAIAAPVAGAAPVCPKDCTLTLTGTFCAGGTSTYSIGNITVPITLTAGTDSLSVDFPTGTDLSSVLYTDVLIDTVGLDNAAALTKSGTHLEAVIPVALIGTFNAATPGHTITVANVVNPTTAGKKCLFVDYKLACCLAVQFNCKEYTVAPAISTLNFHFDFDKSYPGIAEDFIPPFKACGQNDTGFYNATVGWMNIFDVILRADVPGCIPPCTNATMWFTLTKAPAGEVVTFHWDTLAAHGPTLMYTLTAANVGTNYTLPNVLMPPPSAGIDVSWEARLHFSSPGDYEICFYLKCPAVPCLAGAQIVAQKCMPVTVKQWKDSGKIILDEKWNLVSLPIVPFDTSIASLLKSLDAEVLDKDGLDDLVSIHNYDRPLCVDPGSWKVYKIDGTQTSLLTMEDGKSYWVRMTYPMAGSYTWWVFGTALPMPPASPKEYPACTGWNMMGFTSLVDKPVTSYLWNWAVGKYVVYGWDNTGNWLTSGWDYIDPAGIPPTNNLETGQGYWAAFQTPGGYIYVPGP